MAFEKLAPSSAAFWNGPAFRVQEKSVCRRSVPSQTMFLSVASAKLLPARSAPEKFTSCNSESSNETFERAAFAKDVSVSCACLKEHGLKSDAEKAADISDRPP